MLLKERLLIALNLKNGGAVLNKYLQILYIQTNTF